MGSAGVRAISDKAIQIDFQYQGVRCRERLRLKPSPANLRKAARHRAAILSAIENETFDYQVTFPKSKNARRFLKQDRIDIYLLGWLDAKEPTIKKSTHDGYRKIIEGRLIPAFGSMLLQEFKRTHARDFAASLTCSNKRTANIISVMRSALDDAVYDEMLDANVLAGWHYRRQEAIGTAQQADDKPDPFDSEEQAAILAHLKPIARPLIEFALWSGLRTSELVALEWRDIDWDRKTCRVERALTQAAKGRVELPKTAAGIRTIDMLPRAVKALREQLQISGTHASGRVFLNPRTGNPWTGDQAIRKTLWVPALVRADVRYRRQYQTRHTYASMMISAGEPIAWVSKQMGHSDVLVTARIYAKWIPQAGIQVGSKADHMFGQN